MPMIFFADNHALTVVSDAFKNNNPDIVYGDLDYIKQDGSILRKWRSGAYKKGLFNLGWMPPHLRFTAVKRCLTGLAITALNMALLRTMS
jgi:hypothetical protein